MPLTKDLVVRFECQTYSAEKVIVAREDLPVQREGLVFHRANLVKGTAFKVGIHYGREVIDSLSDQLPVDWSNPVEWAFEVYGSADKGILKPIPIIGSILENLAPDAHWNFDLWYDFRIDGSGLLEYKLHFGPTSNVGVRKKLEGSSQLV